ncbi:hypothetical protein [Jeotgalicoccus sp. FSL K6-3177]|uniref:hypothetical protein n=1 Tax=Jeotgalicoccus sp. FSL K6-3177 TaxID=2921494 RepID=UPI0030FD5411
MSNLLEFKRSFMKSQMHFGELSEYSSYTFDRKLKDFYEHITEDAYMEPYFSQLKEGFKDFNEKDREEMGQGAVFLPDDKKDRLPSVLGMMNEVARGSDVVTILKHKYGGSSTRDAFNGWYHDIATYVINDIFSDIAFDIQAIENKQENKDKDDENITVPQNVFNYHGGTHNTQIGNNNVQNITADEFIGELHKSDLYSNDENKTIVVQHARDLHEEVSKEEPSKSKIKKLLGKIKETGEDEAIEWVFSNLKEFPIVIEALTDLI